MAGTCRRSGTTSRSPADTFKRERTGRGRRNRTTYAVVCGVHGHWVAGQDHAHREYDQSGRGVPDTLELQLDGARPREVHNHHDALLESQDRQPSPVCWFRIGGGVPVLLGVAGLGARL